MAQTLTMEQLTERITATVKQFLPSEIRQLIEESVQAAMAPLKAQQSQWGERLFGANGQGHREEVKEEPGLRLGRIVRAAARAKLEGLGPAGTFEILAGWGYKALADEMQAARQKALTAGDLLAGGVLVPEQISTELIPLLRPAVVVRKLGARVVPMPTGVLRYPKLTSGATATWVGESTNITKSQQGTGQVTLRAKKLAALVPVSNDLIRQSNPAADAVVRDDIVRQIASAENAAFIRNQGTENSPKGLRYWTLTGNVIVANATVSLANTTTDLGKAVLKLKEGNVPMTSPAWIFAPRSENYLKTVLNSNGVFVFRDEMLQGTLWGWPFGVTTDVPTNLGANSNGSEVYIVDMADVLIGDTLAVTVDVSVEAAYDDGGTVRAPFSRDETVVRAIEQVDLAVRHEEAIALLDTVTWGV